MAKSSKLERNNFQTTETVIYSEWVVLRGSLFPEAEHAEKIKLVQISSDINGTITYGSLRIARLTCKPA